MNQIHKHTISIPNGKFVISYTIVDGEPDIKFITNENGQLILGIGRATRAAMIGELKKGVK